MRRVNLSHNHNIKFFSNEELLKLDNTYLFQIIKDAFDSSIPWSNPKYDESIIHQYVKNAYSMIIIEDISINKTIAMSLSFNYKFKKHNVFYIAGIWVSKDYQGLKLGTKIIDNLIKFTNQLDSFDYLTLRTHNPKVIKFFLNRSSSVYPFSNKELTNDVIEVGDYIFKKLSPNKNFVSNKLIIRELYDKGFVVGKYHIINDKIIEKINSEISIDNGDAYILVIPTKEI